MNKSRKEATSVGSFFFTRPIGAMSALALSGHRDSAKNVRFRGKTDIVKLHHHVRL
jgi:hypothetical protein